MIKTYCPLVFIGIDPGKKGAVVILSEMVGKTFAEITPTEIRRNKGKGSPKSEYLIEGMVGVIRRGLLASSNGWNDQLAYGFVVAAIEKQQVYPRQGGVSNFTTGYGYGLWLGILATLGIRTIIVRPQEWKQRILPDTDMGKLAAIKYAEGHCPSLDLYNGGKAKKPHDGIADAYCIAEYAKLISMEE